jgi:hypothetical protein
VAKGVKTIPYPPYSWDITPATLFLYPRVASELAGLSLSQDSFKMSWVRVMQAVAIDESTTAFWQLYERYYKCVRVCDDYLEKVEK